MTSLVQVEFSIRDVREEPVAAKSPRGRRLKAKAGTGSPRKSSWPPFDNDGFVPMEEVLKEKAQKNAAKPPEENRPSAVKSNVRVMREVPVNAELPREQKKTPNKEHDKPKVAVRPAVSALPSKKRDTPFDRWTAAPPPWQFSEKIDLNDMLLDADAKTRKFRYDHPYKHDRERMARDKEQQRPPTFVKDVWLQRHGKGERDWDEENERRAQEKEQSAASASRPRSAPATARQKTLVSPRKDNEDYHAAYQPVREKRVFPARERLNPKTSGKVLNHPLPLYPALKELQDHGIHDVRWSVMTIASDDPDRCLPTLNQPTKSKVDFEKWHFATTTFRGEAIETIKRVDTVRDV